MYSRSVCTLKARRYILISVNRRQHRAEFWYPGPNIREGQKAVSMQDLNCGQMCVSECKVRQVLLWEHGFAEPMTSLLIIPSVLAAGVI